MTKYTLDEVNDMYVDVLNGDRKCRLRVTQRPHIANMVDAPALT